MGTGKDFGERNFSEDKKRVGKLEQYTPEELPGMHLYTTNNEYRGKIIIATEKAVILLNGKKVKRKEWKRYTVTDRPPENIQTEW